MGRFTTDGQISFAVNALEDLVASFESRGEHVSHILCGDFNIEPRFPAYQLLKGGRLSEKEMEALKSGVHPMGS